MPRIRSLAPIFLAGLVGLAAGIFLADPARPRAARADDAQAAHGQAAGRRQGPDPGGPPLPAGLRRGPPAEGPARVLAGRLPLLQAAERRRRPSASSTTAPGPTPG